MTTVGDSKMKMKTLQGQIQNRLANNRKNRPSFVRQLGIFEPSYQHGNIADEWHRTLTGRQSPEPVSQKLKLIYGRVISEKLPADMLELLSQLETKSSKN